MAKINKEILYFVGYYISCFYWTVTKDFKYKFQLTATQRKLLWIDSNMYLFTMVNECPMLLLSVEEKLHTQRLRRLSTKEKIILE